MTAQAQDSISTPQWTPRILDATELSSARLMDIHEVCARVGFSRAQVYDLMAKGKFPSPIKFSPGRRGSVRWPDIWINDWLKLTIEMAVVAARPNEDAGGLA